MEVCVCVHVQDLVCMSALVSLRMGVRVFELVVCVGVGVRVKENDYLPTVNYCDT